MTSEAIQNSVSQLWKLEKYLDNSEAGILWQEVGLGDAIKIINDFEDNDWTKLYSSWREKNIEWQFLLAGVLGGVKYDFYPDAEMILIDLLEIDDYRIAYKSVQSLDVMRYALKSDGIYLVYKISDKVVDRLNCYVNKYCDDIHVGEISNFLKEQDIASKQNSNSV